jgi:hypothetical protein
LFEIVNLGGKKFQWKCFVEIKMAVCAMSEIKISKTLFMDDVDTIDLPLTENALKVENIEVSYGHSFVNVSINRIVPYFLHKNVLKG